MKKGVHLYGWLAQIKEIVPPLCVEIFLNNGKSYYLHSVYSWEDEDPIVVIKIWDFREFKEEDFKELKNKMGSITSRKHYDDAANVHPQLHVATMRLDRELVSYVIEWHDKLWSVEEKKEVIAFHLR